MNQKGHFSLLPLVCLAFLCGGFAVSAQTNAYLAAPEPAWVKPCPWTPPEHPARDDNSEGAHFLLFEQQENPELKESYTRTIRLMQNEAGVQDCGSLSFSFDPAYEQLIFHKVQIYRDGHVLDRLDLAKIKVIQPEENLGVHMLTGIQNALVFVEDLRVGDVLECSYTIRGANPIMNGHFATRFYVQTGVAVDRQRMRVVAPEKSALNWRQHLVTGPPRQTSSDGYVESTWNFGHLESIPYEDYVPESFERYPFIELSDFTNWQEVVDWALPLYDDPVALTPAMQEQVNSWMREVASPAERACRALQFVQDDLRYTALELGPDSFRPAAAADTFARRFGDCKGKVLLLCTLLRAMQIEAVPALVNATVHEAVTRRLPSPFDFDHVIVKMMIDGRPVWVDPTMSYQGGNIWQRYVSPFGKALLVAPGVTALEDVPSFATYSVGTDVRSEFHIYNYSSPADLNVKTIYRGYVADFYRKSFARNDPTDMLKQYMNFYARYYPGIQKPAPLQISDDRADDILTVTEHYQVRNLWETNRTDMKLQATFYTDALVGALVDPNSRLRKLPLRISYPMHRKQELAIYFPDQSWNLPDTDHVVDNPAFHFQSHHRYSGSVAYLSAECEARAQQLPPADVAVYLDKCDEVQKALGITLSLTLPEMERPVPTRLNLLMIVLAGLSTLVVGVGCVWFWRASTSADNNLPPVIAESSPLQGLRGWLILVGLGLVIAPLVRLRTMGIHWKGYFSMNIWELVTTPGNPAYHPLYGPVLVFEVLGNVLILGLIFLSIILFFEKRRVFPKVYITLLVTNLLFAVIDHIFVINIHPRTTAANSLFAFQTFMIAIMTCVWTLYMFRSRRVKATFVR